MRILYTLPDLHFGGAGNLLAQNIQELAKSHEVFIVYFGQNQTMLPQFIESGIVPIRFPYNGYSDFLRCTKNLKNFIVNNNIELVHSNLFLDKILIAFAVKKLKVVRVTTIHSATISKYSENLKNRLIFRIDNYLHNNFYNKTVVVSQAAKKVCIVDRKIHEKKIKVILNGIPGLTFNDLNESRNSSSTLTLGTACRFQKIKGLERLIEFFYLLNKKIKCQLILIGDGPEREVIENKIEQLGLAESVKIIGFTNEVGRYLNEVDFYVNSSYSEAMPVSVIEALSLGKPVIASDVGGLPEIINDGSNGVLVDFENIPDAALKAVEFISNRNYDELSNNAYESFIKKFSTEVYVGNLNELYSDLVSDVNSTY